jgi:oligopeptide transport system permease protein
MDDRFKKLSSKDKLDSEQVRESLTYWKDVWRRLKMNKLAVFGLVGVILTLAIAVFGPLIHKHSYEDQYRDFGFIPPVLELYDVSDDLNIFMSKSYQAIIVTDKGELVEKFTRVSTATDIWTYELRDEDGTVLDELSIDLSYSRDPSKEDEGIPFSILYHGEETKEQTMKVWNHTFFLGSDRFGRDILARTMYGMLISIQIAFFSAFINLVIGVLYGSVSGYFGGTVDTVMMAIVNIINSIPLLLYVILLMVVLKDSWIEINILDKLFGKSGLGTIVIALVTVYWVGMARLVRGQVIGLKEQEYVLAARTIGVSNFKIITRHLIPNALGPIIVTVSMMIPSAVFTEAFLSYIGIGIVEPAASLGSLANDGAAAIDTYTYLLLVPSLVIAFMMLSFNFFGDGLRDALDPRLRKG